ncbi:hypothetical protein BOTBODRAFT_32986 [Botryobasidium botryosum FD-172 SS1]|uniref:Protein BIG1 n=1 Tax=Botryobasidium botryosum (strain FD-172 SS1) TaxID=930990 RepID=A0A067MQQ0_BOTB1|nr:hypothetical protein BOTBODRAFT_32986 [Botryobasidium botryosum FD-172 SS1]
MHARVLSLLAAVVPASVVALGSRGAFMSWSSHPSPLLSELDAGRQGSTLISDLFGSDEMCQYSAVVVVDQPGLDVFDLYDLPRSSSLSSRMRSAPSKLFLSHHPASSSPTASIDDIVQRCGSRLIELDVADYSIITEPSEKHVISISMPDLGGDRRTKKVDMVNLENQLSRHLAVIAEDFPSHLVVVMGTHGNPLAKRQAEPSPTKAPDAPKRHRIFTTGLITGLLITFGLLIPLLYMGISSLTSIQAPLRMEAPKGVTIDKKNK